MASEAGIADTGFPGLAFVLTETALSFGCFLLLLGDFCFEAALPAFGFEGADFAVLAGLVFVTAGLLDDAFFETAFLAGLFLAGAFFAGAFLAGAFFVVTFLVTADFLAVFADLLFAAAVFLTDDAAFFFPVLLAMTFEADVLALDDFLAATTELRKQLANHGLGEKT
ncbi:MAG: hypothetical protein RLN76_05580 [Phycisphaeraceae bacterium]